MGGGGQGELGYEANQGQASGVPSSEDPHPFSPLLTRDFHILGTYSNRRGGNSTPGYIRQGCPRVSPGCVRECSHCPPQPQSGNTDRPPTAEQMNAKPLQALGWSGAPPRPPATLLSAAVAPASTADPGPLGPGRGPDRSGGKAEPRGRPSSPPPPASDGHLLDL